MLLLVLSATQHKPGKKGLQRFPVSQAQHSRHELVGTDDDQRALLTVNPAEIEKIRALL